MSINVVPVKGSDYNGLLTKFPEQYREKLRLYTGEELFYIYKLATYKPRIVAGTISNGSDAFFNGLKFKLFRWLKGDQKYGVHPSAWLKLGSRFRGQFHEFVIDSLTIDMIDNLTKSVNAKRVS